MLDVPRKEFQTSIISGAGVVHTDVKQIANQLYHINTTKRDFPDCYLRDDRSAYCEDLWYGI